MNNSLTKKQGNGSAAVAERTRNAATYTPRFDIVESSDELVLFGDLPGVTKENLDIRFENGELAIEGNVPPRNTEHEFVYGEYGVGDFRRNFTINETVNAEKISAELRSGVLTLHLPKVEAAKPRKIEVKESH